MRKKMKKYKTVLILYCVIVVGVLGLQARCKTINETMEGGYSEFVTINK